MKRIDQFFLRQKRPSIQNSPFGFTLLEVLIALAILSAAIILLSTTWSGNTLRLRKANLYNNVAFLLERKVSEIEAKYKEKPLSEIPEEESGSFEEEGLKQYSWRLKSQDFKMPDLTSILVGQEGGADENMISMIRQMNEYISQSVKEVTISVVVQAKKREVVYSITTYFVTYDEPIGLGGLGGG